MNGYIKNLGVILRKAQGVVDVDTAMPIDIGDEVLSIRQECDGLSRGILAMGAANDELRAKLAESEKLSAEYVARTDAGLDALSAKNDELRAKLAEVERERDSANFDKARMLDERQIFLKGMDELRAEVASLKLERDKAYGYGSRLFLRLAPDCEVCDDLSGLMTQLDNVIYGLRTDREAAEARLRELREAVAKEFTIARGFVSALQYQTTAEQDVPMVLRQIDKIHASLAKSGEP